MKDIERYSDKYKGPSSSDALDELFTSENMQQYVPEELLESNVGSRKPRLGLTLDQLVKKSQEDGISNLEANEKRGEDGEQGERGAQGLEDDDLVEDAVEEDLDDDYAVNYYDSGGDESDDNGGEPVF